MKKIYVWLFVTAGIILSAGAQPFEKGQKLLGGSIYFANGDNTSNFNQSVVSSSNTSFGISPAFGIFTKQNRLSGISLSYQYSGSSSNSSPKIKNNSYGAGIFRQYWNSLGNKFYFNIQGQLSANYSTNLFEFPTGGGTSRREQKTYSTYLSVDPGFAYRVKSKLILDFYYSNFLRTGYSYSKGELTEPGTTNTSFKSNSYVLDAGLRNFSFDQIRFGFRYVL